MSLTLIYVTFGSKENAHEVAKNLVGNNLVSCANIFPEISSVYKWEGKIQEEHEVVAIFKTRTELFCQVAESIKSLHSYDTPCIIALPIENIDAKFFDWITEKTKSGSKQ